MESGYKILWTDHALSELEQIVGYLEENWSERELKKFSRILDRTIELISDNPKLFPISETNKKVHRAVVTKHNTLYYQINKQTVELLSLFSNAQSPDKLKL